MTFLISHKGLLSRSSPPRLPPWPLATVLSSQRRSPFCHPERSRGTCGAPEPKTKGPTSEFADLAQSFTRDEKPLDRASIGTDTRSGELRTASLPSNNRLGNACELTRRGFCFGFRRTAGPSASLGMTTRREPLRGEDRCQGEPFCAKSKRSQPLSEALRRSIANRELYGAESKDPGDAYWQMLLGAFRPRTTPEDFKRVPPEDPVLGLRRLKSSERHR